MLDELEWQTRRDRINTKLKALNPAWNIIKYREGMNTDVLDRHAVEEYPTASGPADYALFVQGKLLGIIEAKKVSVSPQNVLEQAKRYARSAFAGSGNWNGYRVPFLYASNGETVWFIDVRDEKNLSRKIADFHTPDALREAFLADKFKAYAWLINTPIGISKLYDYQRDAITAIEEAIIHGRREMLVAMATGTGKTFTMVSLIHRLLESRAVRKILFLVDRRALAAQAVREFASFDTPQGNKFDQEYEVYSQRFKREDIEDDQPFDPKLLPESYLTAPKDTQTFVYVSTIQRMTVNLFGWEQALPQDESDQDNEDDAGRLDIPIHAFDLIIADECHRGYTAKETAIWRSTLDYFDAIKIGLTATPAAHTTAYFRNPVFRYTTEQAIEAGYLVDYDAIKIRSGVRMQGAFLREGEQVGIIDTVTGVETLDVLEDEREFNSGEIEVKITAPESNRKIMAEIARYASDHEKETGRFPKILIFAANDVAHISHADQLVKICKEVFDRGDDFVQKITGSPTVDRPLQKIRQFRNRPKPRVVVTVDMLSTGVDIPELEFIVFLRPVKSRILWVQMLGRGTRRCPSIGKEKFTIFDCFDGTLIEYFRNATDVTVEALTKEPTPISQVIENIYENVDRDYNTKVLIKRLHRIDRAMSAEARAAFHPFIANGDLGAFANTLKNRLKDDFTATMRILRDPQFQDLLINYQRAKKSFFVGYEVQDEVTSEVMIRVGGAYQKPEDYLDSFARFVRENPEHIEAIRILLERPKDWKTAALEDLQKKLALNHFPEKELQKAHKLVHHKALADIISMVKHAADAGAPILNATERVDKALARFTSGKSFSTEQHQWLGYIREHLVANLTLELEDFTQAPVFARHGGMAKVKHIFGTLEALITEINYAIAA